MAQVRNPYRIEPPFHVSFSGGRSSGYMLYHILDAWDGQLPPDAFILFANTGKECEESLEFVRDCGQWWNVPIRWLEYRYDVPGHLVEVDFATASRKGEPFEELIVKRNAHFLPNPTKRICTFDLKVNLFRSFMWSRGYVEWDDAVGFRADEPARLAKIKDDDHGERTVVTPMVTAGVTKMRHVIPFWRQQPFDLRLPDNGNGKTLAGNCDLCFLKSVGTIKRLIREQPERADWWVRMESTVQRRRLDLGRSLDGVSFRIDRPGYAQLREQVLASKSRQFFPEGKEGSISCYCTD